MSFRYWLSIRVFDNVNDIIGYFNGECVKTGNFVCSSNSKIVSRKNRISRIGEVVKKNVHSEF